MDPRIDTRADRRTELVYALKSVAAAAATAAALDVVVVFEFSLARSLVVVVVVVFVLPFRWFVRSFVRTN